MTDDPPAPTQADAGDGAGDERLDGEIRDQLPANLDVTGLVGPYLFPDNARRRTQGLIHLFVALVLVGLWAGFADGGVLVNDGYLVVAGILALAAAYSLATSKRLQVRELDALAAAAREIGFPVGHASAQMAWRGFLSVPTWRVLVYSADEPPTQRGLVVVDGTTGEVLGSAVEKNPDDLTGLGI